MLFYFLSKRKATVLNKLFCPPLCLSNPIMKLCNFDYLKYPVKCSAKAYQKFNCVLNYDGMERW